MYLQLYLLTYLLTPWSRAFTYLLTYLPTYYLLTNLLTFLLHEEESLLEKLTGSQLVKKFPIYMYMYTHAQSFLTLNNLLFFHIT